METPFEGNENGLAKPVLADPVLARGLDLLKGLAVAQKSKGL
jgi:hypothetical protein